MQRGGAAMAVHAIIVSFFALIFSISQVSAVTARAARTTAGPVSKVLELLSDLQVKVTKEGEAAQKSYEEFSAWCEDRSKNLQYEVKTQKAEIEDLEATIQESTSSADSLAAKIEDTASALASNDADLKAATTIRATEAKDFAAEEKEMVETIGMLERAITILEREQSKGGSAALAQLKTAGSLTEALSAMVKASMLRSQDADKLTALVQQKSGDDSQDDEGDGDALFGAPEAAAYKSHSSDIVETLEGLLDKAKDMLDEARKKERNSKHNFEMLEQNLKDEIKFAGADLGAAKKALASKKEAKASAEGDLGVTTKSLEEDTKTMKTLKQDCLSRAQEYEAAVKSRSEELKALSEAKSVLSEKASGASDLTYSMSFLQLDRGGASGLRTSIDLANFEAVRFVRNLAKKEHSEALAQLARRMAAAMRYESGSGEDPFAKVRALITGMIEHLEQDAQAEASHKAYCDKEIGETMAKKSDKEAAISKLTAKIDSMTSHSAQLKDEVAALQKSLAELSASQTDLDGIRREEKAQYQKNKPEMESGLEGVKMAITILREYYSREGAAHETAEGGASGIIGMLEVVESDFAKSIAEMSANEANAEAEYKAIKQENEITKATRESDVKYKTKEYKQLDAAAAEASSDREGAQTELNALLEYDGHLLQMCTSKPSTYEDRKVRREAEISGLKEALSILEGEAMLLQRRAAPHRFRRKGQRRIAV